MKLYAAPMEGITNRIYRRLREKHFPGADKVFAPFISPTPDRRLTPRELDALAPAHNEGVPLVPQLLVNAAEPFLWAAEELAAMGYGEINLNLGCPSRTVTAKGKGAGALDDPAKLDRLLDGIFSAVKVPVSVKTRMGVAHYEEFAELAAVYAKYPVAELTVHARLLEDQYRLPAAPEELARYAERITVPLCYNGDVFSPADLERIGTLLPSAQAVMLGRGLIADPGLIERLRGGTPGQECYTAFHDELMESYRSLGWSERAILCHMKELWVYMGPRYRDSEKCLKRIKKAQWLSEYAEAAGELFRHETAEEG